MFPIKKGLLPYLVLFHASFLSCYYCNCAVSPCTSFCTVAAHLHNNGDISTSTVKTGASQNQPFTFNRLIIFWLCHWRISLYVYLNLEPRFASGRLLCCVQLQSGTTERSNAEVSTVTKHFWSFTALQNSHKQLNKLWTCKCKKKKEWKEKRKGIIIMAPHSLSCIILRFTFLLQRQLMC